MTCFRNKRFYYNRDSDFYDPDQRQVCTHGIHFFMEREEAKNFYFTGI